MTQTSKKLVFERGSKGLDDQLAAIFETAFTASEGVEEGKLIADLYLALRNSTPADDFQVFSSWLDGQARACVLCTRMRYSHDTRVVWLMAPVAVRPELQRQGEGQRLIRHGLDTLREAGADVIVTYGDPAYYGRQGFVQVTTAHLPAPYPLSMPHGWQAHWLTDAPPSPLQGAASCAPAWGHPALW